MKKRTFNFDASAGAGKGLSKVLQHYASVAFPVGGSDCAAASRQALLDLSERLEPSAEQEPSARQEPDEIVKISTRQRPVLKSALNWFYEEIVVKNKQDELLDKVMYDRILLQLKR